MNLNDARLEEHNLSESFQARRVVVAAQLGAEKLGCSLMSLDPGQKAWPYHLHHVNEEMFLILKGEGLLRIDGGERDIREGDMICLPPGPDSAHQIVNNSNAELRYLAISTMEEPEVTEFPDSDKIRTMAGSAPGGDKSARTVDITVRREDGVDYLCGEGSND